MKKKKIAFVIPKIGKGGAEQVVIQLSDMLSENNFENICICFEDLGEVGEKLIQRKKNLISINSQKNYDFLSLFRLFKIFKYYKPDVVSVHSLTVLPYVVLVNLFLRRKIVFTAHGLLYSGFENKKYIYRFFSKFIDKYTAVSKKVSERHREYIGWNGNIEIIENGSKLMEIDRDLSVKMRNKFSIKNNVFVFLMVGNIKKEKGLEVLLNSIFILDKSEILPDYKVLIVGGVQDNYYNNELKCQITSLGIENRVVFTGYQSEVSPFYSCADAFVLSSHSEGLPMVVLEAMSCRLPVVSTSVGGLPKVLSGGAGVLVEPNSPSALADAMLGLILDSVEGRSAIGNKGYQRMIGHYSLERMANQYISVFNA